MDMEKVRELTEQARSLTVVLENELETVSQNRTALNVVKVIHGILNELESEIQ